MDMTPGTLPLAAMKQAMMKIDSAITDLNECKEDEDIDDDSRNTFSMICETLGNLEAHIVNVAMKEISEEDFIAEQVPMDPIDPVPGENEDILDDEI